MSAPAFSITGGADSALFAIDSATGVLTFVSAPDFKSPSDVGANNIYEVEVTADDGNGGTDVQVINVSVDDLARQSINGTSGINNLMGTLEADIMHGGWRAMMCWLAVLVMMMFTEVLAATVFMAAPKLTR